MGRHRPSGPDPVKVSLLLSPEINRQIEGVAARRRFSKSDALRRLLELGLAAEQQREEGSPSIASPISLPVGGHEGPTVTIALSAQLWASVGFAARVNGLQPSALVEQLLSEYVTMSFAKVRQELEEFRRLGSGGQQKPPPSPS